MNYIRYKEDLKSIMPEDKDFQDYTRYELIIKFLPLVEAMARKFSTADQASGILSILDLLQIGSEALTRAVDKLDWDRMKDEEGKWRPQNEIEQTLKSFFSKNPKTILEFFPYVQKIANRFNYNTELKNNRIIIWTKI